jgi:ser/thr/tyr protein kinase RAD53
VVKVADFGLAKVTNAETMLKVSEVHKNKMTLFSFRPQTMCGTPAYLAPEVVMQANQEGYDNLVDSWSVGVIVFSMYVLSLCTGTKC